MTIYLGADHAGFQLKEILKKYLGYHYQKYRVVDFGPLQYDEGDDYPDFVKPVAEAVSGDAGSRGIIIGGSGQGEVMAANRVAGVRAAVYYGGAEEILKLSRQHNDANVLALGARFLTEEQAIAAVTLWLETSFSGEDRHHRRLAKF